MLQDILHNAPRVHIKELAIILKFRKLYMFFTDLKIIVGIFNI